jgi:hypothetical protein
MQVQAQREACESYIKSQQGEGWPLVLDVGVWRVASHSRLERNSAKRPPFSLRDGSPVSFESCGTYGHAAILLQ